MKTSLKNGIHYILGLLLMLASVLGGFLSVTPSTQSLASSRLPSEYTEVEYIESTGAQYIDTGLVGKPGYTMVAQLSYSRLATGGYQYFAGYAYTGSEDRVYFGRANMSGHAYGYTYGPTNSDTFNLYTMDTCTWHTIKNVMEAGNQKLYVDNALVGSSTYGNLPYDESNPVNIYMFKSQYVNTTNGASFVRCSGAQWYYEGSIVRNFVPCYRNSDRIPGMYDLVTKSFFPGQGNSQFLMGQTRANLPSGYTPVEYIQSSGTQYIDTTWVPDFTQGWKVEVEYMPLVDSKRYALVSNYTGSDGLGNISLEISSDNRARFYNVPGIELKATTNTVYANSINSAVFSYYDGTGYLIDNGLLLSSEYENTSITTNSCYLFFDRALRTNEFYSPLRMYSVRLYNGSTIAHDLVPALRQSDNTLGMYDVITNTFLTNSGSGTFTTNNTGSFIYPTQTSAFLPSTYTELEYIESTGTQYIDTGLSLPYGFRAQGKVVSTNDTGINILGAYDTDQPSSSSHRNYFTIGGTLYNFWLGYGNGYAYFGPAAQNTEYIFDVSNIYGNRFAIINGIANTLHEGESGTEDTYTSKSLYVFNLHNDSSASSIRPMKLYYMTIYNSSDTLVRNFIPARRNSDGVVGLYDVVNDTFYTNRGTGSFIAGPAANIPSEYLELEYIESTGTQYIDTGFTANQDTRVLIDYQVTGEWTHAYRLMGGRANKVGTADDRGFYVSSDTASPNTKLWFQYGQEHYNYPEFNSALRHVIDFNKNVFSIDNNAFSYTFSNQTFTCTHNFTLFGGFGDYGGTVNDFHANAFRIYSCAIYDNGALVRDYVPALRNSDGAIGLYDKVNGVFYGNSGTGSFLAGPAANWKSEYTELKSIESTGTQYIDTNFVPNQNTRIVCDYQDMDITVSTHAIIGVRTSQTNGFGFGARDNYNWYAQYGEEQTPNPLFQNDTNRHIVNFDKNKLYFDNTLIHTYQSQTFDLLNKSLHIFKWNDYNNAAKYSKSKLYSCMIYDNGTLARYYIPCYRNSDGAIGLYDKVNGVFYGNNGTGSFLAGPIVDDGTAPLPEGAESWDDVYTYSENGSSVTITGIRSAYAGFTKTAYIPATIGGLPVTAISANAFAGNTTLERVVAVSADITSIGASAFEGCVSLTHVYMGSSLASVGARAFYNTSVEIFAYTTTSPSFGVDWNFNSPLWWQNVYTTSGTSRLIITGLKSEYAGLTALAFPAYIGGKLVNEIGVSAFEGNQNITAISFYPLSQLDSIEAYAFRNSSQLYYISYPPTVTNIGTDAFLGTKWQLTTYWESAYTYTGTTELTITSLKDAYKTETYVFVPRSIGGLPVVALDNGIFKNNTAVQTIEFADDSVVTTFGYAMFYGTTALTKLILPESLTTWNGENNTEYSSFYNSALKTVDLPASLATLGNYVFYYANHLTTLNIPANGALRTIGQNTFADSALTSLTFPVGFVSATGSYAFNTIRNLKTLTFLSGNTNINSSAGFMNCESLEHIYGGYVKNALANDIFNGCSKLDFSTITFTNITGVNARAFKNCTALTGSNINLSNVTSFSAECFSGCTNFNNNTINWGSVTNFGTYSFYNCSSLSGALDMSASPLTSIPEYCFAGCSSLSSLVLPSRLTTINQYAFNNCRGLTSVTFPSTLSTIGNYAFQNNTNLVSANFEDTALTSIGDQSFYQNKNLISITMPSIFTSFGAKCFGHCYALTSIDISATRLTTIATEAFRNCTSLSDISLPDTLTTINSSAFLEAFANNADVDLSNTAISTINIYAFQYSKIRSIKLPNSTLSIGANCFESCTYLTTVNIPAECNITSLGKKVFNGCTSLTGELDFSNSTFTTVGGNTFYNTRLTSIILPSSITTIDVTGFRYSRYLQSVNFEDLINLNKIYDSAFSECSSLQTVDLRNTVITQLNANAFNACGATEYYLPDTLTTLQGDVFKNTSAIIRTFYIPATLSITLDTTAANGALKSTDRIVVTTSVLAGEASGTEPVFANTALVRYVPRADLVYYTGTAGVNLTPYDVHITLNANGGQLPSGQSSIISISLEKLLAGENIDASDMPLAPEREGYTFGGWYKSEEFSGSVYGFTGAETNDFVLYAKWINNSELGDNWTGVYTFTLSGSSATITGINSLYLDMASYVIPRTVSSNGTDYYTVVAIGERAFANMRLINSIAFATDSVCESFGANAFMGCVALQSITLPATLTGISYTHFVGDVNLSAFMVAADGGTYKAASGLLYNATGTELVLAPLGMSSVTILDSCTTIKANAFVTMPKLVSVDLNAVSTLEAGAFTGCSSLVSVAIPKEMVAIPNYAFSECANMTSVVIRGTTGSGGSRTQIPAIQTLMVPSSLQGVLNVYVPVSDLTTYQASNWALYNLLTYEPTGDDTVIYLVTFDYNGGNGGLTSIAVPSNTALPIVITPTRLGYTFDYFTLNGSQFAMSTLINDDITLVAQWSAIQYRIVYYLMGGEYTGSEGTYRENSGNQIYEVGYTLEDFGPSLNLEVGVITPTRVGYDFVAWYTNSDFDSARITSIRYNMLTIAQVQGTQDVSLYAYWKIKTFEIVLPESDAYLITLGINSSTTTEWGGNFVFSITYTEAYTQNTPANVIVTASDGDSINLTLTATTHDGVATYTLSGIYTNYEISISGIVINTYNVYFRSGQTNYSTVYNLQSTVVVEHGQSVKSALLGNNPSVPAQEGYGFLSYNEVVLIDGEDVINNYAFDFNSAITSDIIVTAMWSVNYYSITYYLNGGTLGQSSATSFTTYYSVEDSVVLPANTDLTYNITRVGYAFRGWWSDATLNGDVWEFDGATLVQSFGPGATGAKSFTAKWEIVEYAIVYHTNSGTLPSGYRTSYTILDDFELPRPTYIGHTFSAWYYRDDLTGNTVSRVATGTTGNIVVYASYSTNSYTITYHLGGSELAPVSVGGTTYGATSEYISSYGYDTNSAFSLVNNVTREGYIFAGWYDADDSQANRVYSIPAGVTGAKEYWARWSTMSYVISLNYGSVYTGAKEYEEIRFTYDDLEAAGGVIALPVISQSGYYFSGWYSGNVLIGAINTQNYAQITSLTARWSNETFSLTTSGENVDKVRLLAGEGNLVPIMDGTIRFVVDIVNPAYNKSTLTVSYSMSGAGYVAVSKDAQGYYTIPNISGDIDIKIEGIVLNTLTITYISNGGSAVASESVTYGNRISAVPRPTRTGYRFDEWYSDIELNTLYDFNNLVTYDLTLYAKWTAVTYSITFVNNINLSTLTGFEYSADNLVVFGDAHKFDIPAYEFTGWTYNGVAITSSSGLVGDVTIMAQYQEIEYTIVYSIDYGTHTNTVSSYTYTSQDIAIDVATKEGYVFDGWVVYDNNDGHINYSSDSQTKVFTLLHNSYGNLVLTASFHLMEDDYYQISFMIDGLKLTDRAVLQSDPRYLDSVVPIAKTGYNFLGWAVEGTDTVFDFENSDITGNMTFVALYAENTYYVSYRFNDSENVGTQLSGVVNPNSTSFTYSDEVYNLSDASKLGYDFGGWYTDSGYTHAIASITRLSENITIFGKFTKHIYSITYFLSGGENNSNNPQSYSVSTSGTITLRDATKSGYDFVGWFDANNNQVTTIEPSDCVDYTVTASFEIQDTMRQVRYMYGSEILDEIIYTKGSTITPITPEDKRGYNFIGWFEDSALEVGYVPEALDSNLVLYAKFEAVNYNITYQFNKVGGIINPNSVESYNINDVITLEDASKEGYTFDGWYIDNVRVTSIMDSDGNLTLTGRFTPIMYNIYYYDGARSLVTDNPNTYTVEDTVEFVGATKTGYTFDSWLLDDTPISSTAWQMGDLTLFATWNLVNYNINYTFNNKVGTVVNSNATSYNIETSYNFVPASVRGYTFDGWYIADHVAEGITPGGTGTLTVTGKFTPIKYHINYIVENGASFNNPEEYTVESGSVKLNDASIDGRAFYGWQLDGRYVLSLDSSLAQDVTLVAVFESEGVAQTKQGLGDVFTYGAIALAVAGVITILIMGRTIHTLKSKTYGDVQHMHDLLDRIQGGRGVQNEAQAQAQAEQLAEAEKRAQLLKKAQEEAREENEAYEAEKRKNKKKKVNKRARDRKAEAEARVAESYKQAQEERARLIAEAEAQKAAQIEAERKAKLAVDPRVEEMNRRREYERLQREYQQLTRERNYREQQLSKTKPQTPNTDSSNSKPDSNE